MFKRKGKHHKKTEGLRYTGGYPAGDRPVTELQPPPISVPYNPLQDVRTYVRGKREKEEGTESDEPQAP